MSFLMRNYRINHDEGTRDIQCALAHRAGVSESDLLEQLIMASVWRPIAEPTRIGPGRLHWTVDRAGIVTLNRLNSFACLPNTAAAVSGPLPEPLSTTPSFRISARECTYALSGYPVAALDCIQEVNGNASAHLRRLLRALAPCKQKAIGIGWRFTDGGNHFFHSDHGEPSDFPFLPMPVAFFDCNRTA